MRYILDKIRRSYDMMSWCNNTWCYEMDINWRG